MTSLLSATNTAQSWFNSIARWTSESLHLWNLLVVLVSLSALSVWARLPNVWPLYVGSDFGIWSCAQSSFLTVWSWLAHFNPSDSISAPISSNFMTPEHESSSQGSAASCRNCVAVTRVSRRVKPFPRLLLLKPWLGTDCEWFQLLQHFFVTRYAAIYSVDSLFLTPIP